MNGYWKPDDRWKGRDVFVIGGGPSLTESDVKCLRDQTVLGCNEAFTFGARLVPNLFFSDSRWYFRRLEDLKCYSEWGGEMFTHEEPLRLSGHTWINVLRRVEGLSKDAILFGGNSGTGAVNLALMLGATNVYLLGFDCKQGENKQNNWHNNYAGFNRATYTPPFYNFIRGMEQVAKQLPSVFPGCNVINLTPDSALNMFPKQTLDSVLETKTLQQCR